MRWPFSLDRNLSQRHHFQSILWQDVSKKANLQKDWNCPWVSKDGSRLKQAIRWFVHWIDYHCFTYSTKTGIYSWAMCLKFPCHHCTGLFTSSIADISKNCSFQVCWRASSAGEHVSPALLQVGFQEWNQTHFKTLSQRSHSDSYFHSIFSFSSQPGSILAPEPQISKEQLEALIRFCSHRS